MEVELIDLQPDGIPGLISSYIVRSGDIYAIFDPGPSSTIDKLVEKLGSIRGEIHVFVTHIHLDHAGGLGHLLKYVEVRRIYVHPRAVKHLIDPSTLWINSLEVLGDLAVRYGQPLPVPEELLKPLSDGETIPIGELKVKTIYAEGHASHQVAYLINKLLFPGDALGEIYYGRHIPLTPPPFIGSLALATIDRFMRLNPESIALPHYGIYDSAKEFIGRAKRRLLWSLRLAAKVIEEGGSMGRLIEILLEDEEFSWVLGWLKRINAYMVRGYVERIAKGLLWYVEKYGWLP